MISSRKSSWNRSHTVQTDNLSHCVGWCFEVVEKLRRGSSDPTTNTGLAAQGLVQKVQFEGGIVFEGGGVEGK